MENTPLVKFIRNCIQDLSGVFSISSLVKISMTSFPAFSWLFVYVIKKNITCFLKDMNFMLLWQDQYTQ